MSVDNLEPRQIIGDNPPENLISEIDPVSEESLDGNAVLSASSEPTYHRVNFPEIEIEDLTPEFRDLVGGNVMRAKQLLAFSPDEIRGDLESAALKKMRSIKDEPEKLDITGRLNPVDSGLSDAEFNYWMEHDSSYVENLMDENAVVRLSGPEGYSTRAVTDGEVSRRHGRALAEAEAMLLGTYEDGISGMAKRVGYEVRAGFGQVGTFALKGAAGIARGVNDFVKDTEEGKKEDWGGLLFGEELKAAQQWLESVAGEAADGLQKISLSKEAEWSAPEIDTGNPITDFVRSAVFRGTPFMAGSVALAAIPGVGSAGAAGIIATGMGGETYGNLRADGVSPGLSLAAGAVTGIGSYFSTKFQLDNLTRYFGGRAPLRLWSAGTGLEVLGEAGQEALENITQTGAESVARLLGDPDYDSVKFWNDLKTGFLGSLDEGMSAGITTAAMRILGFPIAARNQMRATTFAKAFTKSAESVGKTEMYAEQPEVLAGHLDSMASQYGDGRVYTTVETLNQSGVTREQAIAPVAEGGLGISEAAYDEAGRTEGTLAVGYGKAMVFGQKQADAGNKAALGAFSVAPDAMSVGDIARQRAEAEAIITQAEVYYQEEVKGDSPKTPLRLKIFKAGMRKAGFDAYQAAALTAMYRAGAERNAELSGETVEEWLERKNVRLELQQTILGTGSREATYYAQLLDELDAKTSTAQPASVQESGNPVSDKNAPLEGTSEAAQADSEPAAGIPPVPTGTEPILEQSAAAEQDEPAPDSGLSILPVETPADNAAWEAEAAENVVDAFDVPEAEKSAVAEAVKQVVEATRPLFAAAQQPAPATAPAQANPNAGVETEIIFPAETKQQPLSVHYELVEADSLQPSHTPRDFRPNEAWAGSALAQQRNYDSASMAPIRASIQGDRLNFPAMFNPTTDAVNGPPVVTADGMVLGGNNRTLRVLNRYDQDSYRTMLEAHLSSRRNMFGIRPEAVRGMKRPVLVRVVDAVTEADVPRLIGALNADFTTRRDAGNLAANRGLAVGTNTMNAFKSIGDRTVSAFLDDPNAGYRAITAMQQDGVFQSTDLVGIYDFQNSKWLPGGKTQVEQALFGAVLPDSRLLDEMTPAMQRKLLKALPALVRLKASGSPELATLFQAVAWHSEYQDFKETAIGKQYKTEPARLEAFRKPDMADMFTGEVADEKSGAAWDMMVEISRAKSQKEVAEFFARKADELSGTGRGLFSLMQNDNVSLSGNWGSITFPAIEGDPTIINLLKGANVSTVVHELNHLFLNDLVDLVKAGKGGETARKHFDALNAFVDGNLMSEDREKRRDAFEKIARAWEYYAMNAEAPAPALEEPFATIRKYMAAVYRNVKESPLVEPSPEMRNVFDRMLATDRQIEDAARIRELQGDWTKAGKSNAQTQQRMADINRRRDDRKRKNMDAQQGAGRAMRNKSRLDSIRRVIRGELSKEPAYRAIDIAIAKGGMNRPGAVAAIGEAAVRKIEERHGGKVFAEKETDGAAMGEVAAMAGYSFDTITDMLSEMSEAESIDARTEREARSSQDADDLADDLEREAADEAEGVDDEANGAQAVDAFSEWWRESGDSETAEREEEANADEQDMAEEVELAIEDELAGRGRVVSARELSQRLREWRNQQAALKKAAYEKVFAMSLREAVDIRGFRNSRNNAKRKALEAALAGMRAYEARVEQSVRDENRAYRRRLREGFTAVLDESTLDEANMDALLASDPSLGEYREKVTAFKKREMYHFYEMQAAKEARMLRQRMPERYGSRALQSAINGTDEHNAKIKYEYAQALAEVAIHAGLADSRFLRELAGEERLAAVELVLPRESEELEGLVPSIADTLEDWLVFKERPENFRDFRDFTVTQVQEFDRVMRWLVDNGRGKLAYIQNAEIRNLAELTEKSLAPMLRRDDRKAKIDNDDRTWKGRTLNRAKRFLISLTIPENWFMAMDGNPTIQSKAAGVNQRLLFETVLKANVSRDMVYKDAVAKMKPHFDTLKEMKARLKTVFGGRLFTVDGLPVPEILKRGRNVGTWDADMLISIALQMGNDANLRRLLTDADFDARFGTKVTPDGGQDMSIPRYNFTNDQIEIISGLFTEAEWDAIQGLWDGINSLYSEADAVTFALTDRHVKKEESRQIAVRTADGKEKILRGGYFPLVNDPMLSDRAAQLKEGQSIDEYIRSGTLGNVYGAAKRDVGALKSRARDENGVPMVTLPQILSTNIIVQHIDAMAHYITHALPLRDIDRLTRSDEWKDVYVAKFGQEQYDAIRKWVKNLAMPERGDASVGGRFMERMRSLATVNALGLRWKTGIKQRLGAFQAAAYMGDAAGNSFTGWKYLMQGVSEMGVRGNVGLHTEKIDAVNVKSEFMAARSSGFDREMRAMRDKLSPLDGEIMGRSLGDWQSMAFFWIQANDRAMAYSVWLGAYKQARAGDAGFSLKAKDGETEAETEARIERESVDFADRAARTQASSFAADLTENQRDRGFMRFMSMFMSGNVRQGSRLMQYMDAYRMGDKTKSDVAMLAAREFVFPALAWVFMAASVKFALSAALGLDDDDDDNLLADAAWETVGSAVAPFPLLREVPRIMQYGTIGGDVTAVKSAALAANNLFGIPGRLAEAKYMQAVGQAMNSASYALGIPLMNPLNDTGISATLGLKK